MTASLQDDSRLPERLIDCIENDILPLTTAGVAAGNKIFGAALLYKHDLSTALAETNNEIENPLWHGEMHLLKRYYELPAESRPKPGELLFLSTHEPCSLCLSAITWTGFDNFYYLFSHEDSRDEFAIPHDLKILKEVFDVNPGEYRRENAFWQCHAVRDLVAGLNADQAKTCNDRIDAIVARYAQLSNTYQADKDSNEIPLN
jgi:tRNA(Arg) A34 adenosine deaminase TadA